MKVWLWLVVAVGSVSVAAIWVRRQWIDRHVSPAWLVDAKRRDWGTGIDQACIEWPLNKVINESAAFNAQRLRKRA